MRRAGGGAVEPVRELHSGAAVALGGPRAMSDTRTLPNRTRRMVGAWCFSTTAGPTTSVDLQARGWRRIRTPGCRRSAGWSQGRCCTATASAAGNWCYRAS